MGNNILENIKEQNNKINQCVDTVNRYSIDEEIRLNQELKINEQIRQQNELIRQQNEVLRQEKELERVQAENERKE